MRIHNPDGSEAGACGNGTRCVAGLVMEEFGKNRIDLETVAGTLVCERVEGGRVRVDMGPARLDAAAIPVPAASIWATRMPSSSSMTWMRWP